MSGTNGDGVRCRARASYDSSVIVVLPEGTSVSLRSGSSGDWQPVVCGGENGYIFSEFLAFGGGSGDGGAGNGAMAEISGTNGDGVRCRSQASYNGSVLAVLSEGSSVELRGGQEGDWVPVVCSGSNGWVFAELVSSGGGGNGDNAGDGGSSNSGFSSGDLAMVSGTGGTGVRLRSSASMNGSVITVVAEGNTVSVINGWLTLSGDVPWQYQRQAAQNCLRYQGGLTGITNLIAIRQAAPAGKLNTHMQAAFGNGRQRSIQADGHRNA